ncbi:MAG: ABC transporter substrate-binding protein [Dehalococcoidia bacterium]|nr:ABC transporter substrate-binding protein [Dehalococcoidia bacterium]
MDDRANYWTRYRNRRLSRRTFVAGSGAAAAGAAAILAGCGDDDDNGGKTATATSSSGGSPSASAAASASASASASAAAATRGGTLKLAKQQVDEGMDPGLKVVNNLDLLPSLYNRSHLYQVSTNTMLLDAATAMEQPDNTTIRFTIRDGMKFHNGDAQTAEDFAYTWTRFPTLLKEQGSQANEANWGFIDTVTAPDAKTVVVKLKAPSASAPVLMATTIFSIVNKKQAEADSKKNVQNVDAGAGAYSLDKRDATGTRVVRFKDYYKHEKPNAAFAVDSPYIDNWETSIIVDNAAAKSAFLAGNLDVYPQLGQTVSDKLEFESLKGQKNVTAKQVDTTEARFMAFDNVKFKDIKARRAILEAIDSKALIASLYAGDGLYDGPVGVGLPAFALDQKTLEGYRKFDPADAKKLWEAAGKPASKIRIQANQDPRGSSIAEFIGQQLKQNLGVDTEVLVNDTTTWVARAREPQKQWELFIVPYNFSTTPEIYNMTMMDPAAFAGVSWNFQLDQADPDVQATAKALRALVAAQSQEIDPAKRKQKLIDMQKYALDNIVPGINLPVPGHSYLVYNSRLQNVPEADWLKGLGLVNQTLWLKA